MSGSLPHSIALASQTMSSLTTPGYTTYDLRSDEDTNLAALNSRNAKASSDHIVTISAEAQAMAQNSQKKTEAKKEKNSKQLIEELEEEFSEDDNLFPTIKR